MRRTQLKSLRIRLTLTSHLSESAAIDFAFRLTHPNGRSKKSNGCGNQYRQPESLPRMRYTCHLLRFILTAAIFSLPAFAEGWHHVGRVTHVDAISNGVELQAGETRVRVVAIGDAVIRIRVAPHGRFFPDRSWAVSKNSGLIVRMDVHQSPEAVELVTLRLVVRIHKSPLLVSFFDRAGNLIQ